MRSNSHRGEATVDLEQLIAEITADAHDDNERFSAFRQALIDRVELPCDGFVIGEPVSLVGFDYDGNRRRGVVVRCRREDNSMHVVGASEITLAPQSHGGLILAAYHKWLGIDPLPGSMDLPTLRKRHHKVVASSLDLSRPIELIVLSIQERAARCRLLGTDRVISLRARRLWDLVPGEIAVVKPNKQWSYAGHPYLSGEITSTRVEVTALGLTPLGLRNEGEWDPKDEYWGEEDEPIDERTREIIAIGPRPVYEMEQVTPGMDPNDPDSDPICEVNDLKAAGDWENANNLLMALCQADLRCLDAHAHLGNFVFDYRPQEAIRHYEVGVRIGELSLPPGFNGLLPWGFIDNRPFLRCLHGYGLCLWRMKQFAEAGHVFDYMLQFNPMDNQGVRFLIPEVRERIAWEDRRGERRTG